MTQQHAYMEAGRFKRKFMTQLATYTDKRPAGWAWWSGGLLCMTWTHKAENEGVRTHGK